MKALIETKGFKKVDVIGNQVVDVPMDYQEIPFIRTFKLARSMHEGLPWEIVKVVDFNDLVSTDKPEPGKKYSVQFFETEHDFLKEDIIGFMKSCGGLSFGFTGLFFAYNLSPRNASGEKIWGVYIPLISIDINHSYKGGKEMVLSEEYERYFEIVGLVRTGEGYLRFKTISLKKIEERKIYKGSIIPIFKLVK